MTRIVSNPSRVLAFINQYQPLAAVAGLKGLGLERDGRLIAGVAYEGFNGQNVWMHVAATPGAKWMTRGYLRYCFQYPFEELGVNRVSGYVEASNTQACRFDEHLGFVQEARLRGVAADGGDVVIYQMQRHQCRFIKSEA
jgi:RimJ/RimL family protein N-acetyltransferase